MNTLINQLLLFDHLNQQQISLINRLTKQVHFQKGEYLAEPGHTISFLAFVNSGVLRYNYYNREAENITSALIGEGNFVSSSMPIYPPIIQSYYLQAMTACDLSVIEKSGIQELSATVSNWNSIALRAAQRATAERQSRILPYMQDGDPYIAVANYLERFANLGKHLKEEQVVPYIMLHLEKIKDGK